MIVEKMRQELKTSMKAKDASKTEFLRYWLGQFTLGDGSTASDEVAIKKMKAIQNQAKSEATTFKPEEIAMINDWVPATLAPAQVRELLQPVVEAIKASPKDGQAMGVAMKALKGQQVDSEDVKAYVAELRQ